MRKPIGKNKLFKKIKTLDDMKIGEVLRIRSDNLFCNLRNTITYFQRASGKKYKSEIRRTITRVK